MITATVSPLRSIFKAAVAPKYIINNQTRIGMILKTSKYNRQIPRSHLDLDVQITPKTMPSSEPITIESKAILAVTSRPSSKRCRFIP
jgi:hypothetical protein